MLNNLPILIPVFFGLTTVLTIFLFLKSVETPPQYRTLSGIPSIGKTVLGVLIGWSALQLVIGLTGFYQKTDTLPPRFLLAVLPTLLLIIALFSSKNGEKFIQNLDLKALTYFHIVRIPVELTLFWLYQHGQIPEVMTFEGRNFDILSGITAPFIAYLGFTKKTLNAPVIIVWNVVCLALLFNIVITAVLSAPTPFQQMGFEQPNRAILFFPFIWLPSVIVPLVLFAHLVAIKRLFTK
jgi:hypothetical protein